MVSTTPFGYATPRAAHDSFETAQKLKDGFKLNKLEAAKIMRQAEFRADNYGRTIASVYQLNSLQMAQLFYDIQADYLNRANYSNDNVVIVLKALGYPLSEFFEYV